MDEGRWITTKAGNKVFIRFNKTNEYMNNFIRNKGNNVKDLERKSQKLANERYKLEEKIEKITNDYYEGENEFLDEKELNEEIEKIEKRIKSLQEEENKITKVIQENAKKMIEEMGGLI